MILVLCCKLNGKEMQSATQAAAFGIQPTEELDPKPLAAINILGGEDPSIHSKKNRVSLRIYVKVIRGDLNVFPSGSQFLQEDQSNTTAVVWEAILGVSLTPFPSLPYFPLFSVIFGSLRLPGTELNLKVQKCDVYVKGCLYSSRQLRKHFFLHRSKAFLASIFLKCFAGNSHCTLKISHTDSFLLRESSKERVSTFCSTAQTFLNRRNSTPKCSQIKKGCLSSPFNRLQVLLVYTPYAAK